MPKGWNPFSKKGSEALSKIVGEKGAQELDRAGQSSKDSDTEGGPQGQREKPAEEKGGPVLIPVDRIAPNPDQPRWRFEEDSLKALAESIRARGVLQPVIVRRAAMMGAEYVLLAGERRLRAAKMAGLAEVPAVIRETTRGDALAVAMAENLLREDLSFQEKARALGKMLKEMGSVDSVAAEVGLSTRIVERYLRVYKVIYESAGLMEAFEREADMDFVTAEALARLCENLQGEALDKFIERANALGIRGAIRDFLGRMGGGRASRRTSDLFNIVVRRGDLVFTVRCPTDRESTQKDRTEIERGLREFFEKLTGQPAGRADEGRK